MAKVYALARVVEDETGLEGYDPQLQEPITDPRQRLSPSTTPSARADSDDEESAGARLSAPAAPSVPSVPTAQQTTESPPARQTTGRRWWEFWKR